MVLANVRICRCDTRSHLASELADWRAGYVGRVVTGACSRPGPALSCAAGNGGVRSTGESPRASRPILGAAGEGQTGRVSCHVVPLGAGRVLIAAPAPRTAELLDDLGFSPVVADISEFEKLEGCVTCLSVLLPGQ
jgi:hypothetical protein